MISTRLHGVIDYGVAAFFGVLSTSRSLPLPVRSTLRAAGAYHTGYAALTDYEAGLLPRLTMRQHLLLDTLGGMALCGAGMAMRRQSNEARALLVGLGLLELGVVALSSAEPANKLHAGAKPIQAMIQGPAEEGRPGYPPLDTLKPVAEGVFIVDSLMSGALGKVLPVRMTVIKLPNGGVLLHSPTRFDTGLKQALEAIGPIRHLVAPNIAHWTFLKDWQRVCPDAVTWVAPGLRERPQVRRSGLRLDHDLVQAPEVWGGVIELDSVPGGLGFREITLFHVPTRTLLLTDLVLNLEAPRLPALLRPLALLFGVVAPDGMPPPYLRAIVRWRRREAVQAMSGLLAQKPERVIFAHGRWFEQDGTAALRRSLRWLLN